MKFAPQDGEGGPGEQKGAAAGATATYRRRRGDPTMSGKTDELKGRVKEAAGALTDDEKLKREGRVDQAVGHVKQATDKVIDKVKGAIE
jgi:uncharacterized protein YjbJ (UPF0337 family)